MVDFKRGILINWDYKVRYILEKLINDLISGDRKVGYRENLQVLH